MIPNTNNVATIERSLTGETGKFTVDEESLAHIMSVLTNLYADPEMAVVREYLTNAYDSHVDAGQTRPVEISTPSHWNKSYIIKDFGVGMSVDDIRNIYAKYGASTKRDSDSTVGMLGLGSKSALTYTNMFTIIGVKNGVKAKTIIAVDEEGVPEFTVVDTSTTDEPNGVEIQIPVKESNSFAAKTSKFLSFWADGLVLLDGKEPVKHGLREVKPGIFVADGTNRYNTPDSFIVMGNVAYKVNREYFSKDLKDSTLGFIAYAPMGAVNFVPSRESLNYNTRTKNYITEISTGLFQAVVQDRLNELALQPNHKHAYNFWAKQPYWLNNSQQWKDATYKGDKFDKTLNYAFVEVYRHGNKSKARLINNTNVHNLITATSMIVTNIPVSLNINGNKYFNDNEVPASIRRRLFYYAEQQGFGNGNIMVRDTDIVSPFWAHIPRVNFDDVKDIKIPRKPRAAQQNRPEAVPYDTYSLDPQGQMVYDSVVDMPKGKTVTYMSPQSLRHKYYNDTSPYAVIKKLGQDVVLVITGKNRQDKLVRANPGILPLSIVAQSRLDTMLNAITVADYMVQQLGYSEKNFLTAYNPDDFSDPLLKKMARLCKDHNATKVREAEEFKDFFYKIGTALVFDRPDVSGASIGEKYPLVNSFSSNHTTSKRHALTYVNHIYETEYKNAV